MENGNPIMDAEGGRNPDQRKEDQNSGAKEKQEFKNGRIK